jgi:hypothetical protein
MQPPADAPDLHHTPTSAPPSAQPSPPSAPLPSASPPSAPPGEQRVPAPREPEPTEPHDTAPADTAPADTAPADTTAAPATVPVAAVLTERDEQILAFERKWWKHAGSKEQAVRDTFGLSATRYYQLLNGLLDNPAALAHDPVLVARLRRLRSTRARTRRR